MTAEKPPQIPGYKVISRLGQGGMATVWRAEQTALGREVALKVVSAHLLGDPASRERFLREAKACARVVHPNVIICHDAGQVNGGLFMALELVTGGDLRQLIEREGKVDPWKAMHLLRDCLQGLSAIEDAGLVHRDIKPGNIFLDARGIPKLADLGLARQNNNAGGAELTMPGMIVGTPAYIAPEQARAIADLDIRADIYALGATAFHLVTGRAPYPGNDSMGVLIQVLNDPVPEAIAVNRDVPPEINALLLSLMSKDRQARPANARDAIDCVNRVIDGGNSKSHSGKAAAPATQPPPISQPANTRSAAPVAKLPLSPGGMKTDQTVQLAGKPTAASAPQRPLGMPIQTGSVSSSFTTNTVRSAATETSPSTSNKDTNRPHSDAKIDSAQLTLLAKRIIVDQGGMRAALALAPGASFPRWMLEQIIAAAGVVHGIDESSILAATFPKDIPRRLIMARGTLPSPGVPGRSVRSEGIPALDLSVAVQVSEDAMQAVAFTRPGQLARREDLERGVKTANLRYGLDAEALRRLVDGPPFAGGRVVIARGRVVDPGRGPGFVLTGGVANTTMDMLASEGNLRKVETNEIVAWWDEGVSAHHGMDVLGREAKAPPFDPATPEKCTGTGTEIARENDGRLALRARVAGFVQRQVDGCVRVVGLVVVNGDMVPDHPPIETNDVVMIRGSVKAGAQICTSSDIIIMGDLENALISAGGHVEIAGAINEGEPIAAAGMVKAGSSNSRTIMAGSVRIDGDVRDCDLRATGDIRVRKIVGGAIVAGGNVRADVVGDHDGTTTMLWAGHHLTNSEYAQLAKLAAARCDAERAEIMRERKLVEAEVARIQGSHNRIQNSSYINQTAAHLLQERLRLLEDDAARALAADERARQALAATQQDARKAMEKGENALARIEVGVIANAGAILRLADADAEALKEPRLKLKLGC